MNMESIAQKCGAQMSETKFKTPSNAPYGQYGQCRYCPEEVLGKTVERMK